MPLFFTCSRMIASASSGTTSHTTCSMISRDSLAIASYSGPLAESAASFCSTDALMVACAAGVGMRAGGGAGGGVTSRWRGGGVARRARVSIGAAGPVGCRGGGAAGGGACDGIAGMLGMLGRMTPGIGMFAAGTPISVRPTG